MNKNIVLLALAATIIVSCKKETSTTTETTTYVTVDGKVDKDAVRSEIQKLEDGYAEAMNAKSIEGLNNYYADDAQSDLTGRSVVTGKDAILDAAEADFKELPNEGKVEYTMTDLFISDDGEQVVEVGSYRTSNNSDNLKRKGNFMATFEKRDGKFVCTRDIDSPQ